MEDLMKALTRLANAGAEYLERLNYPLLPVAVEVPAPAAAVVAPEAPVAPRKERKPRTPKAVAPEVPAAPGYSDAAPATPAVEMSEADSARMALETGGAVCRRFANPSSRLGLDGKPFLGRDGKPVGEGFHMVKDMMASRFKVARVADLTHPRRLAFIAECQKLLATADAQPAGAVGTGI